MKVKNVPEDKFANKPASQLLQWINAILDGDFFEVQELRTGAAYCQLMHMLFRNEAPMKDVRFCTVSPYESEKNFKALQKLFIKLGIRKDIKIDLLVKGNRKENLTFLQWAKRFFDVNYNGRPYNALDARGHVPLAYRVPGGRPLYNKGHKRRGGDRIKRRASSMTQLVTFQDSDSSIRGKHNNNGNSSRSSSVTIVPAKAVSDPCIKISELRCFDRSTTDSEKIEFLKSKVQYLLNELEKADRSNQMYRSQIDAIRNFCQMPESAWHPMNAAIVQLINEGAREMANGLQCSTKTLNMGNRCPCVRARNIGNCCQCMRSSAQQSNPGGNLETMWFIN